MLLWIDLETTGLDVNQDIPLEIGLILMEENGLVEIARNSWLCRVKDYVAEPWDKFVFDMHTRNGLLAELRNSATKTYMSWHELDNEVMNWVWERCPIGDIVLHPAGSSVHFDVDFIRKRFPGLANMLHHRHLDVSSVKMLFPLVGLEYDKGPEDEHRVLSDLDNDILWLTWFLKICQSQIRWEDAVSPKEDS